MFCPCSIIRQHQHKDVRKFYAEQVPTKLKDFDVRKLEGKWCREEIQLMCSALSNIPVIATAENSCKSKVQSPRLQQEVRLLPMPNECFQVQRGRQYHGNRSIASTCDPLLHCFSSHSFVRSKGGAQNCGVPLRRLRSGGYWENTLTEKMQIQAPSDRSTLCLGDLDGFAFAAPV